jgi:hypothetical protein
VRMNIPVQRARVQPAHREGYVTAPTSGNGSVHLHVYMSPSMHACRYAVACVCVAAVVRACLCMCKCVVQEDVCLDVCLLVCGQFVCVRVHVLLYALVSLCTHAYEKHGTMHLCKKRPA